MSLYESQANQLFVTSLTNWTNYAGDLQSYVTNTQAAEKNNDSLNLLTAQNDAANEMHLNLQGRVNSLATLQESANANQYIAEVLQSQQSSLDSQNNTVRQQQFKLRDELMHAQYLQRYYETATYVLIMSMIVVLILLIPAALWRIGQMSVVLFSAIVLVVVLVYLCLMVYVSSTTARRVRDSWYQFDWGIDKSMRSEVSVPQASC